MLGAAEIEREGVKTSFRSQPDVAVGPHDNVGFEDLRISFANPRIYAIGGDNEIRVGELQVGFDVALENKFDAEGLAAALQDVEQLLAPDADEAVARSALARSLEDQLDVVPMVEGVGDLGGAFGIGGAHCLHHRVRENDAPAERVIWLVALDHGDGMLGKTALHQQTEIESRRASADTDDPHVASPWRDNRREIQVVGAMLRRQSI